MMKKNVVVIGGGAAGMMAAGKAAEKGSNVTLIEKNNKLGKKVLITGKGRCNLTNACDDVETLINNVTKNSSFLYSAFYGFTNLDTIDFFNKLGVATKEERGKRIFPVSDRSADIVNALIKYLSDKKVNILHDEVERINIKDSIINGVTLQKKGFLPVDKVIIATGGISYPVTGSTGDGYKWATELGHTVIQPIASLVPIETKEKWVYNLTGLSLKNIGLTILNAKGNKVYSDFGEMMFTHFGLTGPVILSASAHMRPMKENEYKVFIDLKPALDEKQLDLRIQRDFQKFINKDFQNSLKELLPLKLIGTVIELSGISPYKKVNTVTKEERKKLCKTLKNIELTVKGFTSIEQAIITSGGISTKEIDPSTMQSKLIDGLFFAGEVIDVDAYTGGFNLQIAFSTGFLAGSSV